MYFVGDAKGAKRKKKKKKSSRYFSDYRSFQKSALLPSLINIFPLYWISSNRRRKDYHLAALTIYTKLLPC